MTELRLSVPQTSMSVLCSDLETLRLPLSFAILNYLIRTWGVSHTRSASSHIHCVCASCESTLVLTLTASPRRRCSARCPILIVSVSRLSLLDLDHQQLTARLNRSW